MYLAGGVAGAGVNPRMTYILHISFNCLHSVTSKIISGLVLD
jgi:hypothetical protein